MRATTHLSVAFRTAGHHALRSALAAAILAALSCSFLTEPTGPPAPPAALDTSFTIGGVLFRNDTSIARSMASRGNNCRLWKFIRKAKAGGTMHIAFLGGSITGGAMASDKQHYFSTLFCGYTAKLFPNATFKQVNAGWGGTNSRFGASRMGDEILPYDPDLVVVEFAVNDDPWDTFTTMASMEGIVRHCLQNPDLPVIMLFCMNRTGDTVNQHLHSLVGNHYGLPLISYRDECWPLVSSGALSPDSIFADAIHPNNRGHQLLAFLLYSFLSNTLAENTPDAAMPVPAPLVSGLYQNAGIQKTGDTLVKVLADSGWVGTTVDYGRFSYQSLHAGESLEFASIAREVTIGYQLSLHTTSRVRITVDSVALDTLSSYFTGGFEGGRMQLVRLFLDSLASAHYIRFTSLDNDTFNIDYVLYAP
jgi:lysophospholipase L1-like esterase